MRAFHTALVAAVSFLLSLTALSSPAHARVEVVATVPDLAALAREVGGPDVGVTLLALPTQDPHFVDAKPSMALALSRADLLLAIGLDLEIGWLPTLQVGARNPRIQVGAAGYLECAQFARLLEVPTTKLDRSQGDVHAGGNPHYLVDPRNAAAVATGIARKLAELDPAHAAAYDARLQAFLGKLGAARKRWEQTLAGLRGKSVLTYHRSWVYLADWLGFTVVAELEPKPGIPPTAAHITRVLTLARQKGVTLILQEAYYPAQTSKLVASKLPGQLVVLDGGAGASEGYVERMDRLVATLAKAGA